MHAKSLNNHRTNKNTHVQLFSYLRFGLMHALFGFGVKILTPEILEEEELKFNPTNQLALSLIL
jgi:hypothetical protein